MGWDRRVDLKIVRFPRPFWDFALLSFFWFVLSFGIGNEGGL